MSILGKFFGKSEGPVLASREPTEDELAAMRAGATGPGSETARQIDESVARRERLDQVVATGAVVVHQSLITGEQPSTISENPDNTQAVLPGAEQLPKDQAAELGVQTSAKADAEVTNEDSDQLVGV